MTYAAYKCDLRRMPPPFEKWPMTSKHHSFVCLLQTVFQVTAPPSDKPLSIFKAPVSWIDQPCGPSNFTTHLGATERPCCLRKCLCDRIHGKEINPITSWPSQPEHHRNPLCPQQSFLPLHDFTQQHGITCKVMHASAEKQPTFALALSRSCTHMGPWLARVSGERVSRSCAPRLLEPGHVSYRPLQKTTAQCWSLKSSIRCVLMRLRKQA